jgi:hypothetical protein
MVRLVFFSSSAISAGRTFNIKLSDLSCSPLNWAIAESFGFEKYWSKKNATSEGSKTFITKRQ